MSQVIIQELIEKIEGKSLVEALHIVADAFPNKVRFSSAFGQEDQVITDAIFKHNIDIEVFTLDTGRLFQETYELIDQTRAKYKKPIQIFYPHSAEIEQMTSKKGMHSFYESVENRKECCYIRKVEPLKRALAGARVWVTGLRADQSENRQSFELLAWDEVHQVIKFNPILRWTYDEMLDYLKAYKVPYNTLHDKGFISIGCAPCTRTIVTGEHPRAGRWWWESSQKECGLHQVKSQSISI